MAASSVFTCPLIRWLVNQEAVVRADGGGDAQRPGLAVLRVMLLMTIVVAVAAFTFAVLILVAR
ncbi:hypothetical protein [Arthrobacter bambusae]|uniref:hypothetical protein n=1 Tax=Arthrobacter bambusae TaxID=1338426 RepID=UPI0027820365|nr:hypothetical protein [Arthrobacter bambusae]MDQ0209673.1 hypothetical protein [Arthrobacter bambusae]MDQ0234001.1 hypothetical protein [Arthrobacter bambusae]